MFYGVGSIALSPGSSPTSKIQFFLTMYSGRSGMIYKIIISSTQDNFGSPLPPRVACALNLLRVVREMQRVWHKAPKMLVSLWKLSFFIWFAYDKTKDNQ